jgi:hypothetical protein
MDPAISDLALDLGQFALDNEFEKGRKRAQPCKARREANRLRDDLVTIGRSKELLYNVRETPQRGR